MGSTKLLHRLKRYILAVLVGNGLEWYDFVIFGYFAPIFSKQFFPSDTVYASLINTYAVFAVGFLSRPFGAYVFGKIGDQHGRKQAMLLSMLLIAFSTFCMGLLPTYNSIGVWAPIALTCLRALQGISLGGEFTSSLSFIIEHTPDSRRGLVGAWIYSGGFLGSVLGASAGTITTLVFSEEQLYAWAWRIPFLFGLLIAFFGYYMRQKVEETPVFLELKKTHHIEPSPFKSMIHENWREILEVVGMLLPNTVWIYLFVFIPTYLTEVMHWRFAESLISNLVPSALFLFLVPLAGHFSDLWGRRKVMFVGQASLILISPIAFPVFSQGIFINTMLMQILISFLFSLSFGPTAALLTEMFPSRLRNTGTAISYHIATGIFGGLTPLILTAAISLFGITFGPMLWVVTTGIIGLFTLTFIRETRSLEVVGQQC